MTESQLTVIIASLCLAAALAVAGLVEHLARWPRASLRAKFATLFVGLAAAEGAGLPAFALTVVGQRVTGLGGAGYEFWMVGALYALLTAYVIGRLFPWREIDALASDPEASIGSILAELKSAKGRPDDRR